MSCTRVQWKASEWQWVLESHHPISEYREALKAILSMDCFLLTPFIKTHHGTKTEHLLSPIVLLLLPPPLPLPTPPSLLLFAVFCSGVLLKSRYYNKCTMTHTYKPACKRQGFGVSQAWGQPCLHSDFQASQGYLAKFEFGLQKNSKDK